MVILDYDPQWAMKFRHHEGIISKALGDAAISIDHVGSTSVPMLAAKPIVDIVLAVENSADESSYLQPLVDAGYVLRVREPDWFEHRMLRTPQLDVHVHVFSKECVQIRRQLAFRDWLRTRPQDRLGYESLKRKLANRDWTDMNAYAAAKTELIEEILRAALP